MKLINVTLYTNFIGTSSEFLYSSGEGFSTPYYRDFYDTLAKVGFSRPRLVHVGKIVINGQRIKDKIGDSKKF